MSERSSQALAAAVKALPTDPAKARKVFVIATDDDPDSADGWLGRVAAGDRSLTTLAKLAGRAPTLGRTCGHSAWRPISFRRRSRSSMSGSPSSTKTPPGWHTLRR
jgi:hypothetical protein